ncbi:MAG: hypothetical protein PHR77_15260 [Kiritimatiellae bacterium]|nr:hypothetical protein [Kiritimatiellia bacterium]MDD5523440.1 hypothetical protein [Kiritimatiellia bacterium]
MKKLIQIAVAVVVIANMTGCASTKGYFIDRRHDSADIFTASMSLGGGARARIGPVHAGLIVNLFGGGLRGGEFGSWRGEQGDIECLFMPAPACPPGLFCHETFIPRDDERGKSYEAQSRIPFITTDVISPRFAGAMLTDLERKMLKDAGVKPDHIPGSVPLYYYTQVECQIGVLCVVRLGFNPGELLDFILGWTTIDIFEDDLEAKKQKEEKSNQTSYRTDNPAVVVR